jgi:hypothetical protein
MASMPSLKAARLADLMFDRGDAGGQRLWRPIIRLLRMPLAASQERAGARGPLRRCGLARK